MFVTPTIYLSFAKTDLTEGVCVQCKQENKETPSFFLLDYIILIDYIWRFILEDLLEILRIDLLE